MDDAIVSKPIHPVGERQNRDDLPQIRSDEPLT